MYGLDVKLDVRQDQSILPLHHNPPWPNISFIKFNATRFLHIQYPTVTVNARLGSRQFYEAGVLMPIEPWSDSIYVKQSTLYCYDEAANMITSVLGKIGIIAAEWPDIVNKFTFHTATTVMKACRDVTRIAALVVDITIHIKTVYRPGIGDLVMLDRTNMLCRKTIIPSSSIQLIEAATRANRPDTSSVADCSICLESLGDVSQRLPCSHLFHRDCVLNWFRVAPTCPLCRFSYA